MLLPGVRVVAEVAALADQLHDGADVFNTKVSGFGHGAYTERAGQGGLPHLRELR
jgi:hypothetical protein